MNHEDEIPFPVLESKTIEIEIDLPETFTNRELQCVAAHDPIKMNSLTLTALCCPESNRLTVDFDIANLKEYIMIAVEFA